MARAAWAAAKAVVSARRWRGRRLGRWRGRRVASHLGGGGGSGGGTGSDVARAAVSLGRWCRLGGGVHLGRRLGSRRQCGVGSRGLRGGHRLVQLRAGRAAGRAAGSGHGGERGAEKGSERGCHGGRRLRCAVQPCASHREAVRTPIISAPCARSMRGENARGSCTTGPAAVHQCTSCLWHARAPERGGRGMRRVGRRGSDGGQRQLRRRLGRRLSGGWAAAAGRTAASGSSGGGSDGGWAAAGRRWRSWRRRLGR